MSLESGIVETTHTLNSGAELRAYHAHSDNDVYNATAVGTTRACLNVIPEGLEEGKRIGRSIVVKSICVRGSVELNTNDRHSLQTSSIWVVLDRDSRIVSGDPLLPVAFATGASSEILNSDYLPIAFLNDQNAGRFEVLKAINIEFNNTTPQFDNVFATWYWNNQMKCFDFRIDCDIPIHFKGPDGTTDQIDGNSIYVIIGNRVPNINTSWVYQWQLLYKDI